MGFQSVCCGLYIVEIPIHPIRLLLLTIVCLIYVTVGGYILKFFQSSSRDPMESFLSAIYCAFSIVTTIGWGNIVPTEHTSRTFAIFYGLIGIPLFDIYIYEIQLLIEYLLWLLYLKIKFGNCMTCEIGSNASKEWDTPLLMILVLANIYVLFGIIGFSFMEDWLLIDSFYYTCITLTTIGFGDAVAVTSWLSGLYYIYIVIGLAILGMFFDKLQDYWRILLVGDTPEVIIRAPINAEETHSKSKLEN